MSLVLPNSSHSRQKLIDGVVKPFRPLHSLSAGETKTNAKNGQSRYEVLGFAPYWTIDKLDNVDFSILTTLSYFGVLLSADGNLNREDFGYQTFKSHKATNLFKQAHRYGTRVVLTVTQMTNSQIIGLLDNTNAQENAVNQIVDEVRRRGIDGVNVDLEYNGDPGPEYRDKFSSFVKNLTERMHSVNPNSKVTVSVYAASVKEPKIYDVSTLAKNTDGVFMMAYDFAVSGAEQVIPTAPLYGAKNGKYWYDVSTAVEDFLTKMPPEKLILGVPYYGYNYLVYQPEIKAQTRPWYSFRGRPTTLTYALASENIYPQMPGASDFNSGWDDDGQVNWKAYYDSDNDTWRMIFIEDSRSLATKYNFIQAKGLAGVGIWALGFDSGHKELWDLLKEKFGQKTGQNYLANMEVISDEQ